MRHAGLCPHRVIVQRGYCLDKEPPPITRIGTIEDRDAVNLEAQLFDSFAGLKG